MHTSQRKSSAKGEGCPSIFEVKKARFGAFWVLFFAVELNGNWLKPLSGMHWLFCFNSLFSVPADNAKNRIIKNKIVKLWKSDVTDLEQWVRVNAQYRVMLSLQRTHSRQVEQSVLHEERVWGDWKRGSIKNCMRIQNRDWRWVNRKLVIKAIRSKF